MASPVELSALSKTARGVWQDESGQEDDDAGRSSNSQAEPPAPRVDVLSSQVDETCIALGIACQRLRQSLPGMLNVSQAVASRHAKCHRKEFTSSFPPAMRMPMVMSSWKMTLRVPRSFGGAISERYTGPTVVPMPTPNPRTRRPMTSMAMFTAAARMIAPSVKKTPANSMVTCPTRQQLDEQLNRNDVITKHLHMAVTA